MRKEVVESYAILRLDLYKRDPRPEEIDSFGPSCLWNAKITVKRVVFDPRIAEEEVVRLNRMSGDDVLYFWQYTRILREDLLRFLDSAGTDFRNAT